MDEDLTYYPTWCIVEVVVMMVSTTLVELIYLSVVLSKIVEGGWLPLAFAIFFLSVMYASNYGSVLKYRSEVREKVLVDSMLKLGSNLGTVRVPGIGLLYNELVQNMQLVLPVTTVIEPTWLIHGCFKVSFEDGTNTWQRKSASPLHSNPHTPLGYANHSTTPQFNTSSTTLQERQVQAHLIVASHNLFLHNHTPSKLHTFLYLHGTPDDAILDAANFLHSLISPLFPPQAQLSVDLIAQLLAKDRLNSFGLMDPYSCNGPQRSIKAYAIYPKATFFNHDCVPNASRFEYVDSTNDDYGHNSTDMLLG
ncbi:Putative potassium transporter 12 [Glycine soja]|uniref:Putative potassium transporter 12 n=1 Tax=Glycine soja TaxID=3848 RepID=A0A0B2PR85_GLYSO|nr:Putative potassium transporter 12 [Glycine soja]